MQKSVFSLKKSVIALAVLSVSGVGVAQNVQFVPNNLSVVQSGTVNAQQYEQQRKAQLVTTIKNELELIALSGFADYGYDAVVANNLWKNIPMGSGSGHQTHQDTISAWQAVSKPIQDARVLIEKIEKGENVQISELEDAIRKFPTDRQGYKALAEKLSMWGKKSPKDSALIATIKNQNVINEHLQELTVNSHKLLKLDIDYLSDVMVDSFLEHSKELAKKDREVQVLSSTLDEHDKAFLDVYKQLGKSEAHLEEMFNEQVEYDNLQDKRMDDLAQADIVNQRILNKHKEAINLLAKVDNEQNERIASVEREKADKLALTGLERLVVKNISGIEKNAEDLVQLGNEVSSGFKKAETALSELSVEVEEGFNRTGKAVNALKEKEVEQDKRLNVVEFGVGTLVEAVQGKADNSTVRALDERIQKSNEEIKLVQQAVGINALGVMNNKMAISELDRRVAKVSREMQKGLAAQSALSQLSPSSNRVGKVNMSAAVGFYNGNSALAIGTGYRVNEGFSARAGFALSGGDVSGGAGINYEW